MHRSCKKSRVEKMQYSMLNTTDILIIHPIIYFFLICGRRRVIRCELVKYQLESTNVSIVSVSLLPGHYILDICIYANSHVIKWVSRFIKFNIIGEFDLQVFFLSQNLQLSQWTTGIGHLSIFAGCSQSRSRYLVTPDPQPRFSAKRMV